MGRVVWLLAASGCSGATEEGGYTLTITPRALEDQEPFDGEATLVITAPDGSVEEHALGAPEGTLTADSVGPLAAGTQLGLRTDLDGETLGWGSLTLDAPIEGGESSLEILVAEVGRIGALGAFGTNQVAIRAAVAVVPGGDAFLFGGATSNGADGREDASDGIKRISGLDEGQLTFSKITTVMPIGSTNEGGVLEGRVGSAATTVEVDGTVQILVTGGRWNFAESGGNSTQSFLFDPVTETVTWTGEMQRSRSEHDAVRMSNGNVLLIDGFVDFGVSSSSYERWDPDDKRFREGDAGPAFGEVQARGAAIGTQGAIVCGGADFENLRWTPVDACVQISLQGSSSSAASLPVPVSGHAMATLPDGRVLLVGGYHQEVVDTSATLHGSAPASDRAFLYDPDADDWTELDPLNHARAHAVAIPLSDGTVVIVGGATEGHGAFAFVEEAVRCAERFDPVSESFSSDTASCATAGAGLDPQWGSWPGEDVVVLEGWTRPNAYAGGGAYGLLGTGPP